MFRFSIPVGRVRRVSLRRFVLACALTWLSLIGCGGGSGSGAAATPPAATADQPHRPDSIPDPTTAPDPVPDPAPEPTPNHTSDSTPDPTPDPPPDHCHEREGSGPLSAARRLATRPGTSVASALVSDVDQDGWADVVRLVFSDSRPTESWLSTLFGSGEGLGQERVTDLPGGESGWTEAGSGDLNGDGSVDLVLTEWYRRPVAESSAALVTYLGDGRGGFVQGAREPKPMTRGWLYPSPLADWDGDGHADQLLVGAAHGGGRDERVVHLRRGRGDGSFFSETAIPIVFSGAIYPGDVTGDGLPDLLALRDGRLVVYRADGDGGFSEYGPGFDSSVFLSLGVIDLDGDHLEDIVTYSFSDRRFIELGTQINLGGGSFGPPATQRFLVGTEVTDRLVFRSGDLDGDGKTDLVAQDIEHNRATLLFLGHGDGSFAPPEALRYRHLYHPGYEGTVDAAVLPAHSGAPARLATFGPLDEIFDGGCPAGTRRARRWSYLLGLHATGRFPGAPATADLDQDGALDLVVPSQADRSVGVFYGRGDGTFSPRVDLPTRLAPMAVALGDLNRDGLLDLVAAGADVLHAEVYLADAGGGFRASDDLPLSHALGPGTALVALADLDQDAVLDVVVPTGDVFLGRGDGGFNTAPPYRTYPSCGTNCFRQGRRLAVFDVDGDSHRDIAVMTRGTGSIRDGLGWQNTLVEIYLGLDGGGFGPGTPWATDLPEVPSFTPSQGLVTRDFDRDGRVELGLFDELPFRLFHPDDARTSPAALHSFHPGLSFHSSLPWLGLTQPGAGDLDGDGLADVVLVHPRNNELAILLGDGEGRFRPPQAFDLGEMIGPYPAVYPLDYARWGVAVGDFDADGRDDVAVTGWGTDTLTVLLSRPDSAN